MNEFTMYPGGLCDENRLGREVTGVVQGGSLWTVVVAS